MNIYLNEDIIAVNNTFEDTVFLYDRESHTKSEINEDMFDIIEFIYNNEGITRSDINKEYDDIDDVIDQLIELNILTTSKQNRYHNIKRLSDINSARLFIELTDKCNLRCKHCYGNFKSDNENKLSKESILNLIDQAIDMNVYQLDLTGGEPLMYDNLEVVLESAYKAGMLVTIFSNLTLLTNSKLDLLKKYKIKKIITSIDSNINKIHDEFRGVEGSLEKTVSNIKKIQNESSIEISVNTMVGKQNKDNIEETVEFLKTLEVPCVLDSIIPNGRAIELGENPFESSQIIHDLYNNPNINVELKITDCGVGQRFMYIKSNGNICLCPSLVSPEFVFENINNDYKLIDVWNKMLSEYGDLTCNKECSKKSICKGGCRARALRFKKSLYEKDINSCILAGDCNYEEVK